MEQCADCPNCSSIAQDSGIKIFFIFYEDEMMEGVVGLEPTSSPWTELLYEALSKGGL